MKIDSWDDYLDSCFEEDEEGSALVDQDLRPYMTPKFERIYLRTLGRIVNQNSVYAHTRHTVRVIARKPRARRGRRRK